MGECKHVSCSEEAACSYNNDFCSSTCEIMQLKKDNTELKIKLDESNRVKQAYRMAIALNSIDIIELKKRWEDFKVHVDSEVTTYTDKAMKNLCSTDAVEVIYNVWLKIEKMEELSKEKD